MQRKLHRYPSMRDLLVSLIVSSLLLIGCSDKTLRVRTNSVLRESIEKYSNGVKNPAIEIAIQEQINAVLPVGIPESKVLDHIAQNFVDGAGAPEKGSPPWEHDYFYRVEGYRDRVQIWYFIKDKKLQRVHVVHTRASL